MIGSSQGLENQQPFNFATMQEEGIELLADTLEKYLNLDEVMSMIRP